MSETLIEPPSKMRKIIDIWKGWPTWARVGVPVLILVILVGGALFTSSKISSYWTDRGIRKDKEKIANTVAEIANVKGQISDLERKESELRGELNRDVETLNKNLYGLEDAKTETNKALANYNAAIKSNSNVNATAEDLLKALERIKDD